MQLVTVYLLVLYAKLMLLLLVRVSLVCSLMQLVTVCLNVIKIHFIKTQLNVHAHTSNHLTMKVMVLAFASQLVLLASGKRTLFHVAAHMDSHLMTLASVFQYALTMLSNQTKLSAPAHMVKNLILLVSVCKFVIPRPLILIHHSVVVHTVTNLTKMGSVFVH